MPDLAQLHLLNLISLARPLCRAETTLSGYTIQQVLGDSSGQFEPGLRQSVSDGSIWGNGELHECLVAALSSLYASILDYVYVSYTWIRNEAFAKYVEFIEVRSHSRALTQGQALQSRQAMSGCTPCTACYVQSLD